MSDEDRCHPFTERAMSGARPLALGLLAPQPAKSRSRATAFAIIHRSEAKILVRRQSQIPAYLIAYSRSGESGSLRPKGLFGPVEQLLVRVQGDCGLGDSYTDPRRLPRWGAESDGAGKGSCAIRCAALSPFMRSAARSPIIKAVALGPRRMRWGMADVSTTRRAVTP
jgi:hypothetical protein